MLEEKISTKVRRTEVHSGSREIDEAGFYTQRPKTIGIWIQGVERLGAAYEGVWRVVRRFLLSSENSGSNFVLVAPARFQAELDLFLEELPLNVRQSVSITAVGQSSDKFDDGEAIRQAGAANHFDVDAWLVPNPMWSGAKHLLRPKVVWFHDFLLAEFPQSYPRKLFVEFQKNVRDLADAGSFFVFLSPHVKAKHGHEVCGISETQSMLIITPALDTHSVISDLPTDAASAGEFIRAELRENLRSWGTPAHAELFYHHVSSYPFESVPYFFVSSQNREHKAFLRLAQIHSAMLREYYIPYSIFTTALVDVLGKSPLERYLATDLLLGDFMSVGKVSEATHSLLYKYARMTIHPSTFEGNFPLPFAESVAVGTPCIMPYSRAYKDLVDPKMHSWVFYSPTKAGLIEKVREVEAHRSEFIAAQTEVLKSFWSYSLADYFDLQMRAFVQAARMNPKAIQYVISRDEKPAVPTSRPSLMESLRPRSKKEGKCTADQLKKDYVQVRVWSPFNLKTVARGSSDGPVMHFAAYLGNLHPTGRSLFLISVEGASEELSGKSLRLGAEIGMWVDGEYAISDRGEFQFGDGANFSSDLRVAMETTGSLADFDTEARSVGWLYLNWTGGDVPEIRVSGTPVDEKLSRCARLACLTGFDRPFDPVTHAKPDR